jgi:3-methylfumaryl-CoA hydratase
MSAIPDLADLGLLQESKAILIRDRAVLLARTLDLDDSVVDRGLLPLPWIWIYFNPDAPTVGLREDGHPRTSSDGALGALTQRMWISGELKTRAPLELGLETRRRSRVIAAESKDGRTGPFLIVTVEHRYEQHRGPAMVEQQQILYRAATGSRTDPPGPTIEPPDTVGAIEHRCPDERLLFRYSALTFNSHRIHYDWPYATDVEGHPGLVVHGPLTATLLADLAARRLGGLLMEFSFRARTPTYAGVPMHLISEPTSSGERVYAARDDGTVVMDGSASTHPTSIG